MAFKHAKHSFLVRLEKLRRDHSEEVRLDGRIVLKIQIQRSGFDSRRYQIF
jgi:hypothetical protein